MVGEGMRNRLAPAQVAEAKAVVAVDQDPGVSVMLAHRAPSGRFSLPAHRRWQRSLVQRCGAINHRKRLQGKRAFLTRR